MFGAAAFTYGILISFILSGATRNIKLRRPHPPMMMYVGYVLCGISVGIAGFAAIEALRAGGVV